jgi:HJR/Mrr/RecB family endonuclease
MVALLNEAHSMSLDINTVTPWHLDRAKAEFRKAEQEWLQCGAVRPTPGAIIDLDNEVNRLANLWNETRSQYRDMQQEWSEASAQVTYLRLRLRIWRLWQSAYCPFWVGGIGAVLAILFVLLLALLNNSPLGFLGAFIIFCLTSLVIAGWFYLMDSEWIDEKIAAIAPLIVRAELRLDHAAKQSMTGKLSCDQYAKSVAEATAKYEKLLHLTQVCQEYDRARKNYDCLREILEGIKYQLLNSNWRDLRGAAFEGFLQQVFEALGYYVETTKASGDQGIDLIATLERKKVAIQAKGYSESVGNHAVMEAHAGMTYYGCHCCVVITNSVFTNAARELAPNGFFGSGA